jgi:hypothetical protein
MKENDWLEKYVYLQMSCFCVEKSKIPELDRKDSWKTLWALSVYDENVCSESIKQNAHQPLKRKKTKLKLLGLLGAL